MSLFCEVFQFKTFAVAHDRCAMKIGTDSVLLGSIATQSMEPKNICDIGTGSGLLALMASQVWPNANITALEIDASAAEQAKENVLFNDKGYQIEVLCADAKIYKPIEPFDLIITNPPYYQQGKNFSITNEQRSKARHDKDLPFKDLIQLVCNWLSKEGVFWLILPHTEAQSFITEAQNKLFLLQKVGIKQKPDKLPNRWIMCFGNQPLNGVVTREIVLYNKNNEPTSEHIHLTKRFYLWKQFDDHPELKR